MERFHLVGCIRVEPPLRRVEFEYLMAFAESRRWSRPDGPYAVPGNPLAECLDSSLDLASYGVPAEGQPGLLCPWIPSRAGEILVPVDGLPGGNGLPPGEVAGWLDYLSEHFLRPGALTEKVDEGPSAETFVDFGFDHVLNGAAAVSSDRTGLLTLVRVAANQIRVEAVSESVPSGQSDQVNGV
ncbi:hypothetical protein ABN028_06610 [Actinopolymorpha sp. B17G11]|uniref:hypothetical protein n=1 Tax=Actinopolymorpha sp. B17G11 TaxID=3160861 RepID=UPI0032E38D32